MPTRQNINIKIGTRDSKLALTQTKNVLQKITDILPIISFETIPMSSPGDRNKETDLRVSSQDFFTEDLDNAILNNEIEMAVHSAKDLPEAINNDIDWFWLPWTEDPRDVIVRPYSISNIQPFDHQQICGISSDRRETYCKKFYPNAKIKSIRGNIEERIAQLDAGEYDFLIMAVAALNRLNLENRISEYIPLSDLPAPEGQGSLAVTFKKNNAKLNKLRKLFVKPVIFAGSGPGDAKLATVATIEALQQCDVCLYDALSPVELLDNLSSDAKSVFVGKRSGEHSMKQDEICQLIANYARQGRAVVRLKGGDPGIFGRLAEEVNTLNTLQLPYKVIPGISSLNSASTSTGLLLTRRGTSRGFSVMTPRRANTKEFEHVTKDEKLNFPLIFFMGISEVEKITKNLIKDGRLKTEIASIVFSAGTSSQEIITSTLANIANDIANIAHNKPGILMVGENFSSKYLYQSNGALSNKKILLTCSKSIMEKAIKTVCDYDATPIPFSLIKLEIDEQVNDILFKMSNYDYLVITSPSSVRCFMTQITKLKIDLRTLPKIIVCGSGTKKEFKKYNINVDCVATENYGAEGLLEVAKDFIKPNSKILRLRSDRADKMLSNELNSFSNVTDVILYNNVKIKLEKIPVFDYIVFASASAVENYIDLFGIDTLKNKTISIIGQPTHKTLLKYIDSNFSNILIANFATINSTIDKLAEYQVSKLLQND